MHIFILMALALPAQEPSGQEAAEKLLREMSDFYGGLSSFKADVSASYSIVSGKRRNSAKTDYSLAVRRPNRLALVLRRSEVDGKPAYNGKAVTGENQAFALDLICDGNALYYYFSPASREDVENAQSGAPRDTLLSYPVSRLKAPNDLDALDPRLIRTEWQLGLIHRNVLGLVQKRSERNMDDLRKAGTLRDAGVEELNSVKCHRLTFEFSQGSPGQPADKSKKDKWEFWIEAGQQHRLMKESMEESYAENSSYSMTITYGNWKLNGPVDDADFKLPPGVEKPRQEKLKLPEKPSKDE